MKRAYRVLALLIVLFAVLEAFPAAQAAQTGVINTDKVFFRMKASTSSAYYALLSKGASVSVTGSSGDFYAVTYNGKKGFVMKKFVTVGSTGASATSGGKTSSSSSSSAYASIASAKTIAQIGAMPSATKQGATGTNVAKLQQALKIKGYYTMAVDGAYGPGTVNAVKKYQKSIGLSQTGDADSTTIKVLFGKITAAEAKKASTSSSSKTTVATDPKMKGITKISQITVPSPTSKGSSGKNVLYLQQALKLKGYYTAAINSKYDDNTVAAVKAFQKAKKLTVDGIAGQQTIQALFGKSSSSGGKVERLDWFNGGSSRIPNGAVFQVKDVVTGRVFSARRLFGSNHMDSEPLTKSDTAIIKANYGGAFSWNRRAILVKYNGHIYAASMNGMPHGTSTIDNNWPGHFCIHFYGSKTHASKKVDAAHQSAIARAMNASW